MNSSAPLLYSYRRCPYAIRARMGLYYAGIPFEVHEISFRDKPAHMLEISPKGTVPVLQLTDGTVIDESLDILYYAVHQNDPEGWLKLTKEEIELTEKLIQQNDGPFKKILDTYKYHNRHPEKTQAQYRQAGEDLHISYLEELLSNRSFLITNRCTLADVALFPFVRQWNGVEADNLEKFPHVLKWLTHHKESVLFQEIFKKKSP